MFKFLVIPAFAVLMAATVARAESPVMPLDAALMKVAQNRIDPSAPSDLRLQFDGAVRTADSLPAKINPVTPPIDSPSANISRAGEPPRGYGAGISRPGNMNMRQRSLPSRTVPKSPSTRSGSSFDRRR